MRKAFTACLIVILMIFTSCVKEKKEEPVLNNLSYIKNRCVIDGFRHEFFEIYNDDTGELIFQQDKISNYKYLDNKCFAVFRNGYEPYYGLYIVNGTVKRDLKDLSPANLITSDLKYIVYGTYENVDKNHPNRKEYTNIVVREIESGNILKKTPISEVTKNQSYSTDYDCILVEEEDFILLTMEDSWGEVFERITISKNDWNITREDIDYSKNHPEKVIDLPPLH